MKNDTSKQTMKSLSKNSLKSAGIENGPISERALSAWEELSGERYQAFVENIEEGVYEVDVHGSFLYFNNSMCKVLGYPREVVQFQNFTKFLDEEDAKKAFETYNRIYQTRQGISDLVWRVKDRNGNTRVIELSANLITNKRAEKIGFRGIARDITDKSNTQEALRKSEKRYRTLLDFVPYPLVVFTLDGLVSYLNPAFTEVFGWIFEELKGEKIPYVPPDLEQEKNENLKRLFEEKIIPWHETRRFTKDGRIVDVVIRGAVYSEEEGESDGELVILRDITQEKRIARNNEALLKISMALPEYPDLEELLRYTSGEVKRLLGTEGSLVILLNEEKGELNFKAAAHDDLDTEKRMKDVRFPANKGICGKVIGTGEPIIVPDTSKDPNFYQGVYAQTGFKTRDLLDVPLRSKDRIIGVLSAMNKKEGSFDQTDVELLTMIAGTVALSIENARFSNEIREAYKEVTSLNRAKDKVINHLSHELKTPLSVLSASLNTLAKRLSPLPEETWEPTIDRCQRNLERILEIHCEVEDIMRDRYYNTHHLLSWLLEECSDELVSLVAEEVGERPLVDRIRRRIDEIFGPKESLLQEVSLHRFLSKTLEEIKPLFSHRQVEPITFFEPGPPIKMPVEPLKKVVVGLIKNAVENTPDEGKIQIFLWRRGKGAELLVRDYGVGITPGNQRRIFEGFFATQETMDYSSKRPFDFNAGGKGADLLRMKIFSERYHFKLGMVSSRCGHIPADKDLCPGKISKCGFCRRKEDCYLSGGTTFNAFIPATYNSNSIPKENS